MTKRTKPDRFLRALGENCQRLRQQRGFSIDRLAREAPKLSSSVIHRLETASGAVTVTALYRYALALGVDLKALFDFPYVSSASERNSAKIIASEDPRVKKGAFKTLLPLYSLEAAAGYFGGGKEVSPLGWLEVEGRGRLTKQMFVAQVSGNSMLPKIRHGDYLVFRSSPEGTRQGRIVLAQYRGPADPETGGSYTVKVYSSTKVASGGTQWRHKQITLSPLNPEYEAIMLRPEQAADFHVVAEYLFTL